MQNVLLYTHTHTHSTGSIVCVWRRFRIYKVLNIKYVCLFTFLIINILYIFIYLKIYTEMTHIFEKEDKTRWRNRTAHTILLYVPFIIIIACTNTMTLVSLFKLMRNYVSCPFISVFCIEILLVYVAITHLFTDFMNDVKKIN